MDHQEFIDDCLREHNRCRALHGVNALRHSINLDKSAQEWADELINKDYLQNSPISSKGEVGENISSRSTSAGKITLSGTEVAKQFYSDIKDYDFSKSSGAAGNFTQMVWKTTEEVGFGIANIKGKCIVVAHYRPAGNIKGNYISNVLPPVGGDGAHAAFVESCYKEKSSPCSNINAPVEEWTKELEAFKTPSSHHRTDSMSSDEHFEREIEGQSDFAKAQKRQHRKFAREMVEAINHYRSLHGVPILKHNKDIDGIAQQWADDLSKKSALSNSNNKYKGDRLGENIASRWSSGMSDYSAKDVVEKWYAQIKLYSFDKEPQNVQGIGNFSQLLWKNTTEIGIGKASSKSVKGYGQVVVCNFHPAGNVLGRFVENVPPAQH